MTIKKLDTRQSEHRTPLKRFSLNATVGGSKPILDEVVDLVDQEFEYPLRIHASFPTPDARLNFAASYVEAADGAEKAHSPVKKQIFNIAASWIDFQNQTVSNAPDFDIQWPVVNNVGQFRRIGFSLIGSGQIKPIFSEEAASVGALTNAGALFVRGGLPLGFIDVECTNALGYFKSAGAASDIIENSQIFRFGSGAGGGGEGDASEILERLKNQLEVGTYNFLSAAIFSQDEELKTDSSTATYSIVDSAYNFTSPGQEWVSVQLADDDFLDEGKDISSVHVETFYLSGSEDLNPLVEASRDGGVNWTQIPMTRIGNSDTYTGNGKFDEEVTEQFTQNYGSFLSVGVLNASNSLSRLFSLANATVLKRLEFTVTKVGAPSGVLQFKIVADNAGSPSTDPNDVLFISSPISVTSLASGVLTVDCYAALPIANYHVVVESDAAYKASYTGLNNVGFDSDGTGVVFEAGGRELDLRVRVTNFISNVLLAGVGVFYDRGLTGIPVDGQINQHKASFLSITDNLNEFTVPFLPDPRLLLVFEIATGQVYRYGAFSLSGSTVIFPQNTFLKALDEEVQLEFFQINNATSYDNSDKNAALLAANHLGSADPQIDLSVAGRGIFLRRPDGTLRELVINDNDEIEIYSV